MDSASESSLIGKDGRPRFGIHKIPINKINLEDYRPYGKPNIREFKRRLFNQYRLKRWQFCGICNEEVVFGLAVVDLGYMANCFAYVFDRKLKTLKEYNFNQALSLKTNFEGSYTDGQVDFQSKNADVQIINQREEITLNATIEHDLNIKLTFKHNIEPLSIITRVGLKGFNYTHKEAGLLVEGTIRQDNKYFTINSDSPAGLVDYTLGYLGRKTFWNWASGIGKDKKGNKIGFNLSQGVNETGYTENCFWVNGKLIKTDIVDFIYDDLNHNFPWKIQSYDGKINLTFHPEGERKAHLNLFLVASRFHQLFGRFEGEINENGKTYVLEQVSGFTEEHESVW